MLVVVDARVRGVVGIKIFGYEVIYEWLDWCRFRRDASIL